MCYCNGMETYELIRSGRKTLALEITGLPRGGAGPPPPVPGPSTTLWPVTPAGSPGTWNNSSAARLPWPPPPPIQAEIGALKEKARQVLPPKIAYYSEKMGLFPTGVRITSARTRYGSCSGKNSLCFSCFLMNCPDAAMDLVVVHELCHIK